MTVPTIVITGLVGVGKTSVAFQVIELLEERDLSHAFFDLDGLTYFHPKDPDDPYGEHFALGALKMLYPRLRERGVDRLILARVLWERSSLDLYRDAIPDAEITVVKLTAPLDVVQERIRRREIGSGSPWFVAQAAKLDAHWPADAAEDFSVATADRDVRSIAEEVLALAGWI